MDKTARNPETQEVEQLRQLSDSAVPTWQKELRDAYRDVDALLEQLNLRGKIGVDKKPEFPLLVPESFARRMQPGNSDDPLLRQVLPVLAEHESRSGFSIDPVADSSASIQPGMIQKYSGRTLLIAVGSCAVHCRYCFRRHFPYEMAPRSLTQWEPVFTEIEERTDLEEVILSGGDPLTLNDRRLGRMIERLAAIPHLERLRIHSRLPIVLPSRVTRGLIASLKDSRLQPIFVVHANH